MAPEVSRPTSLDPEALHVFLTQLPWQAHAARLAGHALGLAVATVLLTVNTPRARRDGLAFGALMGLGVAFDMWRVPHPAPWTVLALATTAATLGLSFWCGIANQEDAGRDFDLSHVLVAMHTTTSPMPRRLIEDIVSPYRIHPADNAITAPKYLNGMTMPASFLVKGHGHQNLGGDAQQAHQSSQPPHRRGHGGPLGQTQRPHDGERQQVKPHHHPHRVVGVAAFHGGQVRHGGCSRRHQSEPPHAPGHTGVKSLDHDDAHQGAAEREAIASFGLSPP